MITRVMTDHEEDGGTRQCGVAILVDGERRAEAWEQVGPFEELWEALDRAHAAATDLFEHQIPGQLRLV